MDPTTPTQQPEIKAEDIPYQDFVRDLIKSPEAILAQLTPSAVNLLHMAIGLAGEGGEMLDAAKKHAIYGQPLSTITDKVTGQTLEDNIKEEAGDALFYIQGIFNQMGWDFEAIMLSNKRKLLKRYAKGRYSDAAAKDRADKQA